VEISTVASCNVEQLKTMIIARGGNVTGGDGRGLNKEQLQKYIRVYLSMEQENTKHTVYFNRDMNQNGIFAKIDTSEQKTVPEIIQQLVRCNEYEPSLHRFFC
jgi:hypothetical protein